MFRFAFVQSTFQTFISLHLFPRNSQLKKFSRTWVKKKKNLQKKKNRTTSRRLQRCPVRVTTQLCMCRLIRCWYRKNVSHTTNTRWRRGQPDVSDKISQCFPEYVQGSNQQVSHFSVWGGHGAKITKRTTPTDDVRMDAKKKRSIFLMKLMDNS